MTTSGGIGGLPPSPAQECQPGQEDCTIAQSSTGWCSPTTGLPVILLVTTPCNGDPSTITTLDAATGAVLANGPVVPCGDKDWEVTTLCDVDPITGQTIATVIQIFEWDETLGTLVRTLERADLPGVPYVPAGTLQTCSGGQLQAITSTVCGLDGGVYRQLTEVVLIDTLDGTVRYVYYLEAEGNIVTPGLGETFTVGSCPGSDSASEYPEDSPHTTGDIGSFVLGVRNDFAVPLTDANGDYTPLATDSAGRVGISDLGGSVSVDDNGGSLTVDGTVDIGTMPEIEVKNDVGNPIPVSDAGGSLTVDGSVAVTNFPAVQPVNDNGGSLTVDDGGGSLTIDGTVAVGPNVTPGTGATDLGKAEDSVHASGDVGVMALAVRNDNNVARTSADGDYSPISVDDSGRVKLAAAKNEDAPHVSGDTGFAVWGVRNDTDAVVTSADGDYSQLSVDNTGRLKTTSIVTAIPSTAGGLSLYRNMDVGNVGQVIKASAGQIYNISARNRANEEVFLKFYNKATPPTAADVPVLVYAIDNNSGSKELEITTAIGYAFTLGIAVRATNGIADGDNTPTDLNGLILNLGFK